MTRGTQGSPRSRRLRAPLVLALGALLAFEAAGGVVLFFARTAFGTFPGVSPHVWAGFALLAAYGVYQWQHLARVLPLRRRLDYALGLLAAAWFLLTLTTGVVLTLPWWRARGSGGTAPYPETAMALHIIGCMLVLTFLGAHLGAVLQRDRR